MEITPNLKMPYIMPSQAQKHVTHNEALRILDALLNLSVLSRQYSSPPAAPAEGSRYLVPANASGLWSGQDGKIAAFMDDEWFYFAPLHGWMMHVADENAFCIFSGSEWQALLNPQPLAGINTVADNYNRLAVASDAVLLTHNGAGHQLKINKNLSDNTASLLFQSGWTGYAEMGLAGENNFSIKVSDDAGQWRQALRIDRASGNIAIGSVWPTAPLHVDGPIRMGAYEATSVPNAAQAGSGAIIFVKTGQNGKPAFSDGARWLWFEDSQPVPV
ncbi:DUF2793 domain-containing protein [Pseudochrobactrum sp. sp1633]|uniref:DUF2793 domain-containing protein n=1 Tax=Pseudochrobactrum sp. sp1633 TaxID=3036706 RepID=UPI0025A5FD2E|nr:DUF2793 domain-containing protein [Pseudochrobactrum sp. sp1633]MDM8345232.1 DUF2793 domain-containing protein [Pseudochrobactrum sp. sp1633]HWD12917.1 DUF2793 domain-containing protein [Pseudochrobactrum sp.]